MRLKSLTALRFIMILYVFVHHLDAFNSLYHSPPSHLIDSIIFEGFIGVTFFFILSGFVVSYGYEDKIRNGIISSKLFLWKRITKIWPLYLVCLLIAIIVYNGAKEFIKDSAWFVFALQSFKPDNSFAFQYNGVAWCVSNILFYYFCFTKLTKMSTKNLCYFWVGLLLATSFHMYLFEKNSTLSNWLFYINPIFRGIDFLSGMLVYRIRKRILFQVTPKIANALEIGSILVLLWMICISISSNIPLLYRWDIYYLLPLSFLILAFSFDSGYISYFISNKLLMYLGNISFAFYLCHQIVLVQIARYFGANILTIRDGFMYGGIGLVVAVSCSIILNEIFEKRISKIFYKTGEKFFAK